LPAKGFWAKAFTPQHVVFCRNVFIYFDFRLQAQLIERLHNVLEPGDFLIVGQSCSLLRTHHVFKILRNSICQSKNKSFVWI
jgi:chemotaxis protein methyltransferase CheR